MPKRFVYHYEIHYEYDGKIAYLVTCLPFEVSEKDYDTIIVPIVRKVERNGGTVKIRSHRLTMKSELISE